MLIIKKTKIALIFLETPVIMFYLPRIYLELFKKKKKKRFRNFKVATKN